MHNTVYNYKFVFVVVHLVCFNLIVLRGGGGVCLFGVRACVCVCVCV